MIKLTTCCLQGGYRGKTPSGNITLDWGVLVEGEVVRLMLCSALQAPKNTPGVSLSDKFSRHFVNPEIKKTKHYNSTKDSIFLNLIS